MLGAGTNHDDELWRRIWRELQGRTPGSYHTVAAEFHGPNPELRFECASEECMWRMVPGLRLAAEAGWRVLWDLNGLIREVPPAVLGNLFRTYDDWMARSRQRPQESIPHEALNLRWEQTSPAHGAVTRGPFGTRRGGSASSPSSPAFGGS